LVPLFDMDYSEFLTYIFQRFSGNVKLDLERITGVMNDMRNPQTRLKGIHIGGTNGKGSACAACEAMLLAHGLKTGMNTSPHLIDYCERFRLNGKNVDFQTILSLFQRYEDIFNKWEASFFEITTAIAFQLFAENDTDAVVIEVGLGGRLDATNLFVPTVSAITTIGLDHVKTLGGTLEQIAFEKAGIIKPNVPLVLGRIEASPLKVILDRAAEKGAPVFLPEKDYLVNNINNTFEGLKFDYQFRNYKFAALQSNLLGRHQADNLALALTVFLLFGEAEGIAISEEKIRFGLQNIRWMGRMQVFRQEPTVIIDGAHNLQGVEALTANLREMFPERKFLFVVSILADKAYEQMLKMLCPLAKRFYISKNTSERAAEIEVQSAVVMAEGIECKTEQSVQEAYQTALTDALPNDIIIGAGSLYTVAEIIACEEK